MLPFFATSIPPLNAAGFNELSYHRADALLSRCVSAFDKGTGVAKDIFAVLSLTAIIFLLAVELQEPSNTIKEKITQCNVEHTLVATEWKTDFFNGIIKY